MSMTRSRIGSPLTAVVAARIRESDELVTCLRTAPESQWHGLLADYLRSSPETAGLPFIVEAIHLHTLLSILRVAIDRWPSTVTKTAADCPELLCSITPLRAACNECLRRLSSECEPRVARRSKEMVSRASSYICLHLQDRLTVRGIAREVGCSSAYLENVFRSETHQSVHEFLTVCRMTEAARMLQGGEKVEVAMRLAGYRGKSAFVAQFCRHIGCRPSEYRHQSRG